MYFLHAINSNFQTRLLNVSLCHGVAIHFATMEILHDREKNFDVSAAQCSVSVARSSWL